MYIKLYIVINYVLIRSLLTMPLAIIWVYYSLEKLLTSWHAIEYAEKTMKRHDANWSTRY